MRKQLFASLTALALCLGLPASADDPWVGAKDKITYTFKVAASYDHLFDGLFKGTPWLESQGDFVVANGILTKYKGTGAGVTVPEGVTEIDSYPFPGCPGLTIYGKAGSYAKTCAGAQSIPFIAGKAPALLLPSSGGSLVRHLGGKPLPAVPGQDGGPMAGAALGPLSQASGDERLISFETRLTKGQRLFFLAPDTFIPLAKPTVLQ